MEGLPVLTRLKWEPVTLSGVSWALWGLSIPGPRPLDAKSPPAPCRDHHRCLHTWPSDRWAQSLWVRNTGIGNYFFLLEPDVPSWEAETVQVADISVTRRGSPWPPPVRNLNPCQDWVVLGAHRNEGCRKPHLLGHTAQTEVSVPGAVGPRGQGVEASLSQAACPQEGQPLTTKFCFWNLP